MRSYFSLTVLAAIAAITSVAAQDCGPGAYGKKCPQGQCCSVYNWFRSPSLFPTMKD